LKVGDVITAPPAVGTGSITNISADGLTLTIAGTTLTGGTAYVPAFDADTLGLIKQSGTGLLPVVDKSTTTIPY
jgi:hypothetical protein